MTFLAIALGVLAFTQTARTQATAWSQCGGEGWTGPTTCVSGYACIADTIYYAQCLPSTSSSVPQNPGPTSTSTTSAVGGSATLLPNQLWIRAVEDPNFHKYLQSKAAGYTGDAVIGSPSTASQLNIVSGQLVQFAPSGSLYAQVATAAANTTRLKVFWSKSPATNVTWSFNGDGVNGVVAGAKQQNTGAFLACNDVSSNVPNVYLNLGAYAYMTPVGCADETLNYYNGATAVA